MNDVTRRWWNILDKALHSYGMIPTRADRCCFVLYSLQSRKQAWEPWIPEATAQQNGTIDAFTESREQSEMEAAFEKKLDPLTGSPTTEKSVARIIILFVDDLFGTGGNEMEQRVLTRLRKYFQLVQKIGMIWPLQDKEFVGHIACFQQLSVFRLLSDSLPLSCFQPLFNSLFNSRRPSCAASSSKTWVPSKGRRKFRKLRIWVTRFHQINSSTLSWSSLVASHGIQRKKTRVCNLDGRS